MRKGLPVILVLLAILLIGGCYSCNIQQRLVGLDEGVKQTTGEIQSQYQRRSDLIPNLVNTVRGAANFEKSTLEAVVNARAKASSIQINPENLTPEKLQEFQAAQGELSQALGRLLVVTENYPQLQATQAFRDLQVQLEGTENRISTARNRYNEAVRTYNTEVRKAPANIFAGMLGFKPYPSFQADAAAQRAPTVNFE